MTVPAHSDSPPLLATPAIPYSRKPDATPDPNPRDTPEWGRRPFRMEEAALLLYFFRNA